MERPELSTETRRTDTAPLRRLTGLCIAASSVEWFDFFLYATASATIFPALFFAGLGETGSLLASFATFGLAFVARPAGGVLFGAIGDRVGRTTALAGGTITMGVATTLIGLLPSTATLGLAAPILLVVLRLAQGLGLGGQWAGSVLLVTEHAPDGRRGTWGGFVQLGSPIGGIVSTGLFALLAATLPAESFREWGWRVPFLLSVLLIALGLYLQKRLEDAPEFRRLAAQSGRARTPVLEVLRRHPRQVLTAACLFVSAAASLWVFITYLLQYLPRELGVASSTALWLVTATQVMQVVGIVVASPLSDRLGRRPVFLVAAVALAVWAIPAMLLIDTGSVVLIAVALAVVHTILGSMYGPVAALFTEMFGLRVRYSGASLGYQLGAVLGGGLAPIIATALYAQTGTSLSVGAYLVVLSVITVAATLTLRETAHAPLVGADTP